MYSYSSDGLFECVKKQCDSALKEIGSNLECLKVSWDDSKRFVDDDGEISCWGPNITDTTLMDKDGYPLFTMRPQNWADPVCTKKSSEICLIDSATGTPILLSRWLREAGRHGGYMGLPQNLDLSSDLDDQVSLRFQTTFVPENTEFQSKCYNYQTTSSLEPKNLILYCTTQGTAVHQDMPGGTFLRQHKTRDDAHTTDSFYIKAETSQYTVGSHDHSASNNHLVNGYCPASVFGIQELGQRQNFVMTVQIPLKAKKPAFRAIGSNKTPGVITRGLSFGARVDTSPPRSIGVSSAARLSLGSCAERGIAGLAKRSNFERDPSQRITVTIIAFNAVTRGVPSIADVKLAAGDVKKMFSKSKARKRIEEQKLDSFPPKKVALSTWPVEEEGQIC